MIELGSVLTAVAVVAAAVCLARPSLVAARLAQLTHLAAAGPRIASWRRGVARAAAGAFVAALSIGLGLPLLAPALGYAAFVAPALASDRRRAGQLRAAERALGVAIEWADALVSIGQPAERAFVAAARQGTGAVLLDPVLRDASAGAALGAPLFRSLASEARAAGLTQLALLADELDRTRDLGRGSRSVVRDARDELRRRERIRAIAAASKVDEKLLLVLVGCYLPALMLAVVVPLFVGLLRGLAE